MLSTLLRNGHKRAAQETPPVPVPKRACTRKTWVPGARSSMMRDLVSAYMGAGAHGRALAERLACTVALDDSDGHDSLYALGAACALEGMLQDKDIKVFTTFYATTSCNARRIAREGFKEYPVRTCAASPVPERDDKTTLVHERDASTGELRFFREHEGGARERVHTVDFGVVMVPVSVPNRVEDEREAIPGYTPENEALFCQYTLRRGLDSYVTDDDGAVMPFSEVRGGAAAESVAVRAHSAFPPPSTYTGNVRTDMVALEIRHSAMAFASCTVSFELARLFAGDFEELLGHLYRDSLPLLPVELFELLVVVLHESLASQSARLDAAAWQKLCALYEHDVMPNRRANAVPEAAPCVLCVTSALLVHTMSFVRDASGAYNADVDNTRKSPGVVMLENGVSSVLAGMGTGAPAEVGLVLSPVVVCGGIVLWQFTLAWSNADAEVSAARTQDLRMWVACRNTQVLHNGLYTFKRDAERKRTMRVFRSHVAEDFARLQAFSGKRLGDVGDLVFIDIVPAAAFAADCVPFVARELRDARATCSAQQRALAGVWGQMGGSPRAGVALQYAVARIGFGRHLRAAGGVCMAPALCTGVAVIAFRDAYVHDTGAVPPEVFRYTEGIVPVEDMYGHVCRVRRADAPEYLHRALDVVAYRQATGKYGVAPHDMRDAFSRVLGLVAGGTWKS